MVLLTRLSELIDEVCVDAAEQLELERKQVSRRRLNLLLLLRTIWEKRTGDRPRRMRVCAWNVCTSANPVRPSRQRTGTAQPSSSSTSSLFPSGYFPLPRLCDRRNRESYFHTSSCAVGICAKMKDTVELSPLRNQDQERRRIRWETRTNFTSLQVKRMVRRW